ncbi:N-acetylmuramoyl-L-alanine amidase family protein [Dendrosporobacter sp. 1207_IL3150]|uniref:N-acetylmuramoyl-L-alanine amidase family protein n=1 Tax=Dendrosporobacter sp. 1207_IL3150 TaxID=3084054 RepID=UPI002FD8EE5F
MNRNKFTTFLMLFLLVFTMIVIPVQSVNAAPVDDVLKTLSSGTLSQSNSTGGSGSNIFEKLFGYLFNKILGPVINVFGSKSSSDPNGNPVKVTPLPPSSDSGTVLDSSGIRGKVIVVDPGHGGSNPGAVANNTRETDNNLSVSLKLRDKLVQAGAKVIMTRETDKTVAAAGSTLGQELQARVDLAQANNADIFVSIHSNSNPNPDIAGAMTFYHSGKSPKLATEVQSAIIKETKAIDKGTAPETFYVLRNTTMPGILVEMGFVTNSQEAAKLSSDSYRNSIAQGIFNGIVKYFN